MNIRSFRVRGARAQEINQAAPFLPLYIRMPRMKAAVNLLSRTVYHFRLRCADLCDWCSHRNKRKSEQSLAGRGSGKCIYRFCWLEKKLGAQLSSQITDEGRRVLVLE